MTAAVALAARLSDAAESFTAASSPAAGSAAADLNGVSEWVVNVTKAMGAPGAGLVVALEDLFPPIPSEVVLLQPRVDPRRH